MENLFESLVVIAITSVLIILLFVYLNQRKRQKDAALRQAGKEQGWQVETIQERLVSGYRLSGFNTQGPWILEIKTFTSDQTADVGSSNVGHSTRWLSETTRLPERAVVIGPAPKGGAGAGFQLPGGSLAQMALHAMLGKDAVWVSQLTQIEAGSASFRTRFLCLAQETHDVERLLSSEVERFLIKFPIDKTPLIKLNASGLEISLPTAMITNPTELGRIIQLGDLIGRSWQRSEKIQ